MTLYYTGGFVILHVGEDKLRIEKRWGFSNQSSSYRARAREGDLSSPAALRLRFHQRCPPPAMIWVLDRDPSTCGCLRRSPPPATLDMDFDEEEIVVYIILEEMYMEMLLLCAMFSALYAETPANVMELEDGGITMESTNMTQASSAIPMSQQTIRKRRRLSDSMNNNIKELRSMFRDCFEITGKRIELFVERIGQAKDLSTDRRKVLDELRKMEHLALKDRISVAKKIVERPDYIDLFFSCGQDEKEEFVAALREEGP